MTHRMYACICMCVRHNVLVDVVRKPLLVKLRHSCLVVRRVYGLRLVVASDLRRTRRPLAERRRVGDPVEVSSRRLVDMTATREFVEQAIGKQSVVIFSKTTCPYCKMAKQVFDSLNKTYLVVELDDREDADEIQSVLGEMTGARTVPRVFLNGTCLGGGTDVKKLYESGELIKKF